MPPYSARRSSPQLDRRVTKTVERCIEELVGHGWSGVEHVPSPHLGVAAAALALAQAADRLARAEIITAREEDGASWETVGEALGISRQAAHARFRTGPDGMHSRLFAKKVAPASRRKSGPGGSVPGALAARKAPRTGS